MIPVTLTWAELLIAAQVGCMRNVQDLKNGLTQQYGALPDDDFKNNIIGTCAEMALAKHLGVYWSGAVGCLKEADVGRLEVRGTPRHDYDLRLHKKDDDDSQFVLVTGVNGIYQLQGWLYAREGKIDEYWGSPYQKDRPAFWVPQSRLRSMETLAAG